MEDAAIGVPRNFAGTTLPEVGELEEDPEPYVSILNMRPGGTLIFMGGTGSRRPAIGMSIASAVTAALPALTANLALEIAPARVNLIPAGFVDTPLSAELLGDQLEKRRNQLRTTLPIGRVMTSTADSSSSPPSLVKEAV
jgi:NAD(P)-dependent dehydrogenase (short-subunit alcohol dehydrogenase family)